MAQRTIHVLFGTLLLDKIEINDKNRFLVGSILPDAYVDLKYRNAAHFIKYMSDENCWYFDFKDFSEKFLNNIKNDDLYLGYYAHLVEDACYRYFLYYEKGLLEKIKSYNLDILHKDYHILNSYIAGKYSLPSRLELPKAFVDELLNEITEFDIKRIVDDYGKDITELYSEKTELLTENMLDEFVFKYIDVLADELNSIRCGGSKLEVMDYRWENKQG